MRILVKTAHPDMPTAYAQQTAIVIPRLAAAGHDVAISCTAGQLSHHSFWRGIPVFGCTPYTDTGEDTVREDYDAFKADLVVTFLCTWTLKVPHLWRDMRVIHLTPVDCDPMSWRDYSVVCETGGTPAAVSRTGERVMRAGWDLDPARKREPLVPLYLPHGTDTKVFRPPQNRAGLRKTMGFDGKFVTGMNFMNNDKFRKNIQEAIRGWAMFHARHPDTLLALHAIEQLPEGYNLPAYCRFLGISAAVRWTPQYELKAGMIPPAVLAEWYGSLDVLLSAGNEGYGLPAIEAQACGTPVILGDWSTGPELAGDGWLVSGHRWYNDVHCADWWNADPASICEALEEAYEDARNRREAARDFALGHDIGRMVRDYWEPVLGELG